MRIRIAVVVAMLGWGGGGCYTPSIAPCQYACAGQSCPSGLVCSNEGMCAETKTQICGGPGDGGLDVPDIDAMVDSPCGWSASNVDVCARRADMVTQDWTVPIAVSIDTDSLSLSPATAGGPTIELVQQLSGGDAALITVHDLNVNFEITLRGSRPLIILVNGTARILRAIRVEPRPLAAMSCSAMAGTNNTATSGGCGGGGGGGFGPSNETPPLFGAAGGGSVGNPQPMGGAGGPMAGTPNLIPLRGGCGGGTGGFITGSGLTQAGLGGGAIQISARTLITFMGGSVEARGTGGSSGIGRNGGGGGGSGGAILLEAPAILLDATSKICANGGGGGAGAASGTPPLGADGTCASIGAAGAQVAAGSNGGNGSGRIGSPSAGAAGSQATFGGGGGGGGAGRIRINGVVNGAQGSLIVPNPSP